MSEDIEHDLKLQYHPFVYNPTESELHDSVLAEIEQLLSRNGISITNITYQKGQHRLKL